MDFAPPAPTVKEGVERSEGGKVWVGVVEKCPGVVKTLEPSIQQY